MNVFDLRQIQQPNRKFSGISAFTVRCCLAFVLAFLAASTVAPKVTMVHARPAVLPTAMSTDVDAGTSFGSGIDIAVDAEGAHSVKTADLDGDGDLDVITASRTDGTLRWYRNMGAATVFVPSIIDVVDGIYIATPGDADNDGDIDIFIASVSEVRPQLVVSSLDAPAVDALGTVLWYENDGQPTPSFTRHIIFGELNYPVSLHVADLDGDGDLDAMSASRDDNRILWYENNGDRSQPAFFPHTISDSTLGAVSVHAADFDGDGDLDVVSASENDDQIAWYENQGQRPPQFTTHVIRYTPLPLPLEFDFAKSIFGVDVDGDGDQDIVFGSEHNNEVGWYENDGGSIPTFAPRIASSGVLHVKMVGAIDLDLDGDVDLLSASTEDHTLAWYESDGNPDPNFVRHVVSSAALGARFVHAADLDGDGDLDLLSASRDDNRITWYENRTIHRSAIFPEEAGSTLAQNTDSRMARAGDLDGDGDLDVASIGRTSIDWYENNDMIPPTFDGHVGVAAFEDGRWLTVVDLDSDGDQDFVYAAGDSRIGWQENDGRQLPGFVDHPIVDGRTAWVRDVQMVSATDLDGDGDLDLYTAGGDRLVWYENLGTMPPQFWGWDITEEAMGIRSVDAADLNGDGRLDLVSASFDDDSIRWYENLGGQPTTFREQLISDNVDGANRVHAVDLDGDGDVDLLSAAEVGEALIWHENIGGFPLRFVSHQIDTVAVRTLADSDWDHDGDQDIVAGLSGEFAAAWYENDGQSPPTFTLHLATGIESLGSDVSPADLDSDGDDDLLAVSLGDGRVFWLENLGGQYGIEASQVPSTWIKPKAPNQLLSIDLTHRGRQGDSTIEVTSLTLRFADSDGRVLTTAQIQEHFTSLLLYRAPCCGQNFNPATNPLLTVMSPPVLDADGRMTFQLPIDVRNIPLTPGEQATYFVAGQSIDACADGPSSMQIQVVISSAVARDQASGLSVRAEGFRTDGLLTPTRVADDPRLAVNEVAIEGTSQLVDSDGAGEQFGWFELFNHEYADVDLGGMYLTNDLESPTLYRIPDGVQIPVRGRLLFIADGNPAAGPTHTSFRLRESDEVVALYAGDSQNRSMIDVLPLRDPVSSNPPTVGPDEGSWGRFPDGSTNLQVLVPTPGAPNQITSGPFKIFLTAIFSEEGCPIR